MTNLKTIDDKTLLSNTRALAIEERKNTIEMIHHLREVECRRLFASLGFSSLFEYCVRELGYSESSAQRRISAMRLSREIPEVEEKIISGELNLTTVSQAQIFFRAESKNDKIYDAGAKREILEKLEGKSTREAERELLKISPEFEPREKVRAISETKTEIKFVADAELQAMFDQLKNLLSHKNPNMNYAELIKEIAAIALRKLNPAKSAKNDGAAPAFKELAAPPANIKSKGSEVKLQCSFVHALNRPPEIHQDMIPENVSFGLRRNASPAPAVKRYIPAKLRQAVWNRDQGRCTFVDKSTGRVCDSKFQLQIDHIKPWALGGEHSMENLRLLCRQHNAMIAIEDFGVKKMQKFLQGLA